MSDAELNRLRQAIAHMGFSLDLFEKSNELEIAELREEIEINRKLIQRLIDSSHATNLRITKIEDSRRADERD